MIKKVAEIRFEEGIEPIPLAAKGHPDRSLSIRAAPRAYRFPY
jgi:hypothetical protein